MATHSSVPAWRILGMREPSGLPSIGSHRVRHNWSDLAAAILSLYLLGIPLSPHPVYIAVLGWPFCILAVCGVIFIVEFPCCGWGCTVGLSRFPLYGNLCRCSGGWGWITFLWSAMKCPVMSYKMSVGLEWLLASCILKIKAVFLCCWRICVSYLTLELVGSWVVICFSVGIKTFDELLLITVPWSQDFSSVLRIWT